MTSTKIDLIPVNLRGVKKKKRTHKTNGVTKRKGYTNGVKKKTFIT